MIAEKLEPLVKQREQSYRKAYFNQAQKLFAISQLKNVIDYCRGKPENQQLNCIRPYKHHIQEILPSRFSRFKGIREKLSNLIEKL